jgi:dipeptidase E
VKWEFLRPTSVTGDRRGSLLHPVRLFLSSASVRGRVEALTELVGPNARVGVSANALDMEPDGERGGWLRKEIRALTGAGLSPAELDLRACYDDPKALDETLARLDMVWATGGNVFVLRKALQRSGLDERLVACLRDDSLAYGGCSAGACVCSPTLRGIELIDDAYAAGEPIYDGLGVVDHAIVPHVGAEGEVGETIARLAAYFERAGVRYRALRDGQAIVVHGAETALIESS